MVPRESSKSTMQMKRMPIVIAIGAFLFTPAAALEGFSTCHAAGTTVTSISGFDTGAAKMISEMTLPDAMDACHRNSDLSGAALMECAAKLMRDGDSNRGPVTTVADCETGTLAVEYSPVPTSTYYTGPNSKHVDHYKFPIFPMCGNDNAAAIAAFKVLCPAFKGKIEADQSDSEPAHIKVFKQFTCSGKVGNYSVSNTVDRSIGGGDSMCYFASASDVGRKILRTCPLGVVDCHLVGTVENDQNGGDWSPIITDVTKVTRR
jgi:hypothetical protein